MIEFHVFTSERVNFNLNWFKRTEAQKREKFKQKSFYGGTYSLPQLF